MGNETETGTRTAASSSRNAVSISSARTTKRLRSRSHDAVIRAYDAAGKVIETHEHKGEFKEW